jgi:hypothetical protein
MATQASLRRRWAPERRFYTGMALAMIALVVIGFGPSFYLRGAIHFPRPNPSIPPLVMAHGVVFTLWMLLFAIQASLVGMNRRDLHMRLGLAGMALAALLVPIMYLTAVGQVARVNQPPFTTALAWTVVPLLAIPVFVALVWLGWKNRRDAQAHKRLMLGAALLMMDPAIGRLPLAPPTLTGHAILGLLAWLMFLPLFWWDWKTRGSLHWATKVGAGLVALMILVPIVVLAWVPGWERAAAMLPGV